MKKQIEEMEFIHAQIIAHSLGVDIYAYRRTGRKRLPKEFYRNRFCAGVDHDDTPVLVMCESAGWMKRGVLINEGKDTLWYVTDEGIREFRKKFKTFI